MVNNDLLDNQILNFCGNLHISNNIRVFNLAGHLIAKHKINVTQHEKTGLMYTKYTYSYYSVYLHYLQNLH